MYTLEFTKTCHMCPEQYDVTLNGKQVAYVRLRGGELTVECPDVGDQLIYEAEPNGDGQFNDDERDHYMAEVSEAIKAHYGI